MQKVSSSRCGDDDRDGDHGAAVANDEEEEDKQMDNNSPSPTDCIHLLAMAILFLRTDSDSVLSHSRKLA